MAGQETKEKQGEEGKGKSTPVQAHRLPLANGSETQTGRIEVHNDTEQPSQMN